jgi:beta-phosphoglucomutase
MFEAAIFDWDGTLADTQKVIVKSFQQTLNEIGCNVTDQFIERRIGIGAGETFREILRFSKTSFDEKLIERLIERKSELEIQYADEVKLLGGARELLESLQGKVKVGLASMNSRSVIVHLLNAKKLEKCFEVVLTADSISHSKPDPEIFLKTAQKLKANPTRCVVLEDSLFGVKAAKAAKMGCIAVLTGVYGRAELEVEKPDLIVESLLDRQVLKFILS